MRREILLVLLGPDDALDLSDLEICHYFTLPAACARARSILGGCSLFEGEAAASRNFLGTLQTLERSNGRMHDVDGVVATERLRQDVRDTSAHSSTARTAPPAITPVPGLAGRA